MDQKLYKQLLKKDLIFNAKGMIVLIICETILIAISFASVSACLLFLGEHSSDSYIQPEGIVWVFISSELVFLFCGIVLLITVLISYLSGRIPDYIMLKRLGITSSDLKKMVATEAALTYIASLIIGFIVGIGLFFGLKLLIENMLKIRFTVSLWILLVFPAIAACMLLMYFLSFKLVGELESDFLAISNARSSVRIEHLKDRLLPFRLIIGIALCIYSVIAYTRIYNHESVLLIIALFGGLYLVLRNMAAIVLTNIKNLNPRKYYRKLIDNNKLYYRLSTVSRYLLVFTFVGFLMCFFFGFQAISVKDAAPVESLYPYDGMFMATDEDQQLIDTIKTDYDAEIIEFPMVRVANKDKTETMERRGVEPIQGQQIGISESTYHILKKKLDDKYVEESLGLDSKGKTVYIVHQQDEATKAQPIDWYYNKKKPTLHVGVVCAYHHMADQRSSYLERVVVGEEVGSLIGCYSTEKCENLVVFSDAYFKQALEEWKHVDAITGMRADAYSEIHQGQEPLLVQGPSRLVLFNAEKDFLKIIDHRLEAEEENHRFILSLVNGINTRSNYDSTVKFHYMSYAAIKDLKAERAVKLIVSIYLMCTLQFLVWILLYSMYQLNLDENVKRNQFLSQMGMSGKKRKRMNSREWNIFLYIPCIVILATVVVFFSITSVLRMYSPSMVEACIADLLILLAAYIFINGLFFLLINISMSRRYEYES